MRCIVQCCVVPVTKYLHKFSWKSLYECLRGELDDPVWEIWRLRLNFFVVMVLSFLGGIGYTSTLSTFHQYIINPREEDLNGTDLQGVIIPGLGGSEMFYAWMITVYSLGEVILAPVSGYATRWIPYWYILLAGIIVHIIGYVFYSVAQMLWVMIVARLLTGAYAGIIETISYAYIGERAVVYEAASARRQRVLLGKKKIESARIKEKAYALLTLSITVSYLAGPGVSALVAQFSTVDQFRWVGWFNMSLGIVSLVLLTTLFHGEWKSPCMTRTKHEKVSTDHKKRCLEFFTKASTLKIIILGFFLLASYVMDSSYGVVDTLFNPITSDIFGFTEREISYFFVGVMFVYVVGSLLLYVKLLPPINIHIIDSPWGLVHSGLFMYVILLPFRVCLNTVKINNRIVATLSVVGSIIGAALIADWQSIGQDPCIKFSVFHNPEIEDNITSLLVDTNLSPAMTVPPYNNENCTLLNVNDSDFQARLEKFSKHQSSEQAHSQYDTLHLQCSNITDEELDCLGCSTNTISGCMAYRVNVNDSCYDLVSEKMAETVSSELRNSSGSGITCSALNNSVSVCITVQNVASFSASQVDDFKQAVSTLMEAVIHSDSDELFSTVADIQNVRVEDHPEFKIKPELLDASDLCLSSPDNCYWNQFSPITKVDCFACPPICRSVKQSLNFIQFAIGVTLFVLVIPISRVVLMVLISDNLSPENQGPFTGVAVGVGGIARTLSPIWIDAAYEAVQKRTFLPMAIKILTFIPVLIGLIALYKFLEPASKEPSYSELQSEDDTEVLEEDSGNVTELKTLMSDSQ